MFDWWERQCEEDDDLNATTTVTLEGHMSPHEVLATPEQMAVQGREDRLLGSHGLACTDDVQRPQSCSI